MKHRLLLLIAVCTAVSSFAQRPTAPSNVVAIKTGRILDVRNGVYLVDETIWIEADRIKAVGKSSDIQKQLPASAKIIDLAKETVLPGLIDCHVHLTMSPQLAGPRQSSHFISA